MQSGALLAMAVRAAQTRQHRAALAIYGAMGIAAAQLIYLILLARLPAWIGHPELPPKPQIGHPHEVSWLYNVSLLVPWNLPAAALVFAT